MEGYEWLCVDLLSFIYTLTWLVFLTRKHYGQVTTTAGHIFELNDYHYQHLHFNHL